jgi:hypothetical protein
MDALDVTNFYLLISYTSILGIAIIFVVIKLRFKLDISAWVISLGSLISLVSKIAFDYRDIKQLTATLVPIIAYCIINSTLFYFVFVMKGIRDSIES